MPVVVLLRESKRNPVIQKIMTSKFPNPAQVLSILTSIFQGHFIKNTGHYEKTLSEILNEECVLLRYRKIHLNIYSGGIHYTAGIVSMYYWIEPGEYIIILNTDSGALVGKNFNAYHAEEEFAFICEEDIVENEGKDVIINLFHYTLYENDLKTKISSEVISNNDTLLHLDEHPNKASISNFYTVNNN
jgi:hypothetical protein